MYLCIFLSIYLAIYLPLSIHVYLYIYIYTHVCLERPWQGSLEVKRVWLPHVPIGSHGFSYHFPPSSVPVVCRRRLLGSTNVQPYSDCFTCSDSRREVTRPMFPVSLFVPVSLCVSTWHTSIIYVYI